MSTPSRAAARPAERPDAPLRIELIESLDALAPHADAWHGLLEAAIPGRGFFYRLPMLRAMAPVHAPARHPGGRRSPFLLLAWRGDALVGGLPLVLERKPWSRAGVRRLLLWGGDGTALGCEGDVPLLGVHAERAMIARAFRSALEHAYAAQWDVLEFGYLRGDSDALEALRRAHPEAAWHDEPLRSYTTDLTLDETIWRATRSGGRLRELGRLRRRLEAAHRIDWMHTATLTAAQRAQVATLHRARQDVLASSGRDRETPFADPVRAAAIDAVLDAAEVGGRGRHSLLFADGELAAFLLCLVEGSTLLAWLTAVHERYLPMGAGGLLFWETVQCERTARTCERIEFGPGTTFIKETVGTSVLQPVRMHWTNPDVASTVRARAYEALIAARHQLSRQR